MMSQATSHQVCTDCVCACVCCARDDNLRALDETSDADKVTTSEYDDNDEGECAHVCVRRRVMMMVCQMVKMLTLPIACAAVDSCWCAQNSADTYSCLMLSCGDDVVGLWSRLLSVHARAARVAARHRRRVLATARHAAMQRHRLAGVCWGVFVCMRVHMCSTCDPCVGG
jgi:hypothetical protein